MSLARTERIASLKTEIVLLRSEQSVALQNATFMGMTNAALADYKARSDKLNELLDQLRQLCLED